MINSDATRCSPKGERILPHWWYPHKHMQRRINFSPENHGNIWYNQNNELKRTQPLSLMRQLWKCPPRVYDKTFINVSSSLLTKVRRRKININGLTRLSLPSYDWEFSCWFMPGVLICTVRGVDLWTLASAVGYSMSKSSQSPENIYNYIYG